MPATKKKTPTNDLAWQAEWSLEEILKRTKARIATLNRRYDKIVAVRDPLWEKLGDDLAEDDPTMIRLEALMGLLEDAIARHVDRENITFRTICALGDIRSPEWRHGQHRRRPNKSASWA